MPSRRPTRKPVATQDEPPLPWEQQNGEGGPAYHAFCHYRALPAWKRGLRVAAETHRIECLKKPSGDPARLRRGKGTNSIRIISSWKRYSVELRWVERVREWDRHQQREWLRKQQQAREDMYERHAKIALGMLARVAKRVAAIDVDDLTPQVLVTWFRAAVHVERLARGEPTEVVQAIEPAFDDGPNDLLDYGPDVREAHNALLLALAAAKEDRHGGH